MPQTLTRIATTALLALAAAWANAQAGDWGDVTIVSGTVGNNPNRLCMGVPDHMRPADIGCPSYAPSLSTAGHVSITGNVSAQKFIGDGSGITNLNVQGDRIVSGTSNVTVAENGSVTISTAGSERVVIGEDGNVGIGISTPGVRLHVQGSGRFQGELSSVNMISLKDGYNSAREAHISRPATNQMALHTANVERVRINNAGNVGIGTTTPTATLQVSGSFIVSTSAQTTTPSLYVGTSGKVGIGTSSGSAMLEISPTTSSVVPLVLYQAQNASEALGFSYGSGLKGGNIRLVSGGGPVIGGNPYVEIGHINNGIASVARFSSGYSGLAGLTLYPSNTQAGLDVRGGKYGATFQRSVGIGMTMPQVVGDWAPSTSLHVSGTIRIADGGEACDPDRAGAIRYTSQSTFEFCKGSGWQSMAAAGGTSSDRIVSGTTRVLASENSSVTIRTNNADRVTVGENGRVGIGTSTPNAQLHVEGGAILANGPGTSLYVRDIAALRGQVYNDAGPALRLTGGTSHITHVSGSLIVSSTLTNLTPSLYAGTDGRVGLGTATPSNTLHIKGTGWGANSPSVLIQTSGVAYEGLGFYDDGTYAGVQSSQRTLFLSSRNSNNPVWLRSYWGGMETNQYWGRGGTLIASSMPNSGAPGNHTEPSATLHVSGTIRIADSGEACDGNRAGAIRYTSQSTFEFCKGSGWQSMAAAGGASSDRIVSGTTSVIASEDRSVTISTAGFQRVVIDERGEVTIGGVEINTQDGGSYALRTNLPVKALGFYFDDPVGSIFSNGGVRRMTFDASGQVGVGTTAPSATLHVSGTIKVAGTGAEACDANMRGGMRRNPSSGLMELCQ